MALRPIRIWPDPVLSTVAKPVDTVNDDIRTLVADMWETMYDSDGVGLAANQVGVAQRVVVIDLDPHKQAPSNADFQAELNSWHYTGPLTLINPEILTAEGSIVWDEGCLSVPGVSDSVERKARITVRALDVDGKPYEFEAEGLLAVCVQHEIDHLDGRVFVEYLSKLKRDVIKRKMQRLKANGEDAILAAR